MVRRGLAEPHHRRRSEPGDLHRSLLSRAGFLHPAALPPRRYSWPEWSPRRTGARGRGDQDVLTGRNLRAPPTAVSASLNVTVTGSSDEGYITLFPGGGLVPQSSSLNYRAGQTRANNAIVTLAPDGILSVFCSPSGDVHVILDINGYFE